MSDIDKRRQVMRQWLDRADEARARGDGRMVEAYEYAAMKAARALAQAIAAEARAEARERQGVV